MEEKFYIRFTIRGVAVKFSSENEPPKGFVTSVGNYNNGDITGRIWPTNTIIKIGEKELSAGYVSTYEMEQLPAHYAEQHRKRVMLRMPDASIPELVDRLILDQLAREHVAQTIFACRYSTEGQKLVDKGRSGVPWAMYLTLFAGNNNDLMRLVAKDHTWIIRGSKPKGEAIEVFKNEWIGFGANAWHALCNELFNTTTP